MKKTLAVIIAVAMMISMLPQFVLAEDNGVQVTTINVAADAIVGSAQGSTALGTVDYVNASNSVKWNSFLASANDSERRYYYFGFNLSEFSVPADEVLTSAKFKIALSNSRNEGIIDFDIWESWDCEAGDWSEETIMWSNQPHSSRTDNNFPANPTSHDYDTTKIKYSSAPPTSFYTYEFDMTSMVQAYLNSDTTDMFSFAAAVRGATNTTFVIPVTKENIKDFNVTDGSAHVAQLEITTAPLVDFEVTSTTPANDSTNVDPSEDVVITFNNTIDDTSVSASDITVSTPYETVALSDSDISVNNNTITITKDLAKYSDYTIAVSGISDTYEQTLASPYAFSFSTASDAEATTELIPVVGNISIDYVTSWTPNRYRLNVSNINTEPSDTPSTISVGKTIYLLFKLDISDLDASKMQRDVEFLYTKSATGNTTINIYSVPNGTWFKASDFEGSSNIENADEFEKQQASIEVYYNSVKAAVDVSSPIATHVFGESAETRSVDISSVVRDAYESGESYVTLCLCGSTSRKIDTINGSSKPTVSLIQETPSIDVSATSPQKNGTMIGVNKDIEIELCTIPESESAKQFVELVKADDNSSVDAAVDVDYNKIIINPSSDLEPGKQYKVIFKAGLADEFENSVSADKTALTFTAGVPYEFEAVTLDAASYDANATVTASASLTNNTSDVIDAAVYIALFDKTTNECLAISAGDGVKAVAADGAKVEFASYLTIPEDASNTYVKAFFWNVTNGAAIPYGVSADAMQN